MRAFRDTEASEAATFAAMARFTLFAKVGVTEGENALATSPAKRLWEANSMAEVVGAAPWTRALSR
jgi:hypothetical protein